MDIEGHQTYLEEEQQREKNELEKRDGWDMEETIMIDGSENTGREETGKEQDEKGTETRNKEKKNKDSRGDTTYGENTSVRK